MKQDFLPGRPRLLVNLLIQTLWLGWRCIELPSTVISSLNQSSPKQDRTKGEDQKVLTYYVELIYLRLPCLRGGSTIWYANSNSNWMSYSTKPLSLFLSLSLLKSTYMHTTDFIGTYCTWLATPSLALAAVEEWRNPSNRETREAL